MFQPKVSTSFDELTVAVTAAKAPMRWYVLVHALTCTSSRAKQPPRLWSPTARLRMVHRLPMANPLPH